MKQAVLLLMLALLLANVASAGPLIIKDVAHPRSLLDIVNAESFKVKQVNVKPAYIRPINISPIKFNSTSPDAYVKVNYKGETIKQISPYIKPNIGKTYLLVNISIANHGYKKIWANPNSFYVKVDNLKYGYDAMSGLLKDIDIPMLNINGNLEDGEKTFGYLVFQIPVNYSEYNLIYEYSGALNVIYN